MNILFVVDEFPFPARNGVTIPVANTIERLVKRGNRVDLLLFDIPGSGYCTDSVCKSTVSGFFRIKLRRTNKFYGLLKELLGYRGLFEAWEINGESENQGLLKEYDVVWASPIRSYSLWLKFCSMLGVSGRKTVAAINDSYTLTLAELSRRKKNNYDKLLFRLRANAMYKIETNLLALADLVCVQSQREINFFEDTSSKRKKINVFELKNGVSEVFYQQRREHEYDLLFVGTLDSFYVPTLEWFIDKVYAKFSTPRPSFRIVGRGASDDLLSKFTEFGIFYTPFIDDISSAYLTSTILVAPIFKGYGTINKVIEAMASGCVVVGDKTAFNGLENFLSPRDGLIAETPDEFMHWILAVIHDPEFANRIGTSARNLTRRDFSWDSRIDRVVKAIE